MMTCNTIL